MIELLLIVISVLLVAACGAFVAAEFAFITVDRASVERAAEDGDREARGVLSALEPVDAGLGRAGRDHGDEPVDRLFGRAVDRLAG